MNYPQIYEPQKVAKAPDNFRELFKNEKWMGSVKIDGYWECLCKENNQVYMFSRAVSKKTGYYTEKIANVPHIKEWAEKYLPNGTMLIGEVYVPGGTSSDVTKILGCLPEKAIKRQQDNGNIHYYVHDILKYNGEDYVLNQIDYSHRYSNLCRYIDIETPLIDEIEIAGIVDNTYCDLEKCAYEALERGEEGMVFRSEAGLYLPGKRRPNVMFKIKEHLNDMDFVITKLLDPVRDYTGKELEKWQFFDDDGMAVTKAWAMGWKNSIEISAYNDGELVKVGTVASGIDDAMREDMAKNPDNYLGKVCTIEAMEWTDDGSLRHPVFVQMHPGKDPKECVL